MATGRGRALVALGSPLTLVVLGVALTTISCSSDDPPPGDQTDGSAAEGSDSVDFLTSFYRQSGRSDPNAIHYDDDAARCMAQGLVDGLGEARLADLGLDAATGYGPSLASPPLDEAEAELVFDLKRECADLVAQLTEVLENAGLSHVDAACTASGYAGSGLFAEATASEEFDPELNRRVDEALGAAAAECGVEAPP